MRFNKNVNKIFLMGLEVNKHLQYKLTSLNILTASFNFLNFLQHMAIRLLI